jgi:peptide/nickel transport system permease protein
MTSEIAQNLSPNVADDPSLPPEQEHGLAEQEKFFVATPRQLMWWRFRRHKLAMVSSAVLIGLYLIALFWEFLVPYDPHRIDVQFVFVPPQGIHFFDEDGFHFPPYVNGLNGARDPDTLRKIYEIDPTVKLPLKLFVRGDPYKLLGFIESDLHLFGLEDNETAVYILGTDRLGRDMLSRLFAATRVSTTIGLVGVILSFVLGVLLGGISGYYGGSVDVIIQRIIEFIRAIPSIPLWLGLSAAIPADWPMIRVYFAITIILSLIGWTGLARVVRGKFLSLREEDFVLAARFVGVSEMRIILRHMVPSFMSHIIASLTLAVPVMILSETSLSFLGLGLRSPAISWGTLLKEAQNLQSVALAPWLLIPGLLVVIAVLAFNFVGDGLRDAADPYAR